VEARAEGNEVVAQARAQTSQRETRGVKNETSREITAREEMIEYRDSNFKESNGMFEPNMLMQETKSNVTIKTIQNTPSNDETIRNEFGPKILEDVKDAY
jgi:UDP-N-acetylenolpyruvoylglucosamine reductase